MQRTRARRIFGIWKKSESWVPASERKSWVLVSEEDGWFSKLTEAFRRVPHVEWGVRWKICHRKIALLSPLCRKTFQLKGNKKFRTWTKKSWVFFVFVFRDSYVIYIWVMNILCKFHIFMYGNVTWRRNDSDRNKLFVFFEY